MPFFSFIRFILAPIGVEILLFCPLYGKIKDCNVKREIAPKNQKQPSIDSCFFILFFALFFD